MDVRTNPNCHKVFKEDKTSFPTRNNANLYQLVYNELEEEGDEFHKTLESHIGYLKAKDVQGDGISSDLDLTPSQRVAKLLGLTGSDGWSVGSSNWANDTELRIDTTADPSLEDTFQTELKEARMYQNHLRAISPIAGSSNNNVFEDDADFSIYKHPMMHSTPIKDSNSEVTRTPRVNVDDIMRDDPQRLPEETFPIEDARGSVRFVQTSKEGTDDKLTREESFAFQTALSSQPLKPSLVMRLRNSLKRHKGKQFVHCSDDVQDQRQIVHVTAMYCGPPKFEVDSTDCFFDDDVAQLCQNEFEKPDEDFDKVFSKLRLSTQDAEEFNKVGVLSNKVHFNTDDDYEDALSQDPSDWSGRDPSGDVNLGNARFSKYFSTWMRSHKRHVIIFSLFLILLVFITSLVLLQTHASVTHSSTENVTLVNVTEHRVNLTHVT